MSLVKNRHILSILALEDDVESATFLFIDNQLIVKSMCLIFVLIYHPTPRIVINLPLMVFSFFRREEFIEHSWVINR